MKTARRLTDRAADYPMMLAAEVLVEPFKLEGRQRCTRYAGRLVAEARMSSPIAIC
ncbi:MAG TPA: hypothetical protein VGI40_09505 [Pirellulaceae bacterium]